MGRTSRSDAHWLCRPESPRHTVTVVHQVHGTRAAALRHRLAPLHFRPRNELVYYHTMTEENRQIDGVDTETLEGFAAHAAEHPEEVQFGLQATASYEGTCAHSLARVEGYELGGERIERDTRAYTIPYGGWREVLETAGWVGTTDRLEPVEAALSALAACINVGISLNAVANGIEIDDLETTVRTDFDPAVLFSLADLKDSEGVFENLTADVNVEGADVDPDVIDEWARRAPVYTLISLAQDVDLQVDAKTAVAAEDD